MKKIVSPWQSNQENWWFKEILSKDNTEGFSYFYSADNTKHYPRGGGIKALVYPIRENEHFNVQYHLTGSRIYFESYYPSLEEAKQVIDYKLQEDGFKQIETMDEWNKYVILL